jgi:hypothetical protein
MPLAMDLLGLQGATGDSGLATLGVSHHCHAYVLLCVLGPLVPPRLSTLVLVLGFTLRASWNGSLETRKWIPLSRWVVF